jgi:hypothetical protein
MSRDFDEIEDEFLKDQDSYQNEIQAKIDRRMLVSNFLESKD